MRQITIDCSQLETARQLHETLAASLSFPHWYGHNLDALHDCLTAISIETELTLTGFASLPGFANGFRRVLNDCEEENPKLTVTIL